jgi:DNA-3-methyladenine glycosylase I
MQDAGIIRNRAKLRASVNNSRIYREITREYGSFDAYLQSFTEGKVIREPDISITTSPLSDALSADLKKRGMSFVGSTTIYAFLQAIGVINSHTKDCFCYEQVT